MVERLFGERMMGADRPRFLIMKENFGSEAARNSVERAQRDIDLLLVERLSEVDAGVDDLQGDAGCGFACECDKVGNDQRTKIRTGRNDEALAGLGRVEQRYRNHIADLGQRHSEPRRKLMRRDVGRRPDGIRTNNESPSTSLRRASAWLTADCERKRRAAALVTLHSSYRTSKTRSRLRSMLIMSPLNDDCDRYALA
jgi:hypothetical protein